MGLKTLLLATRNAHKKTEISRMLAGLPVEAVGLEAFPDIAEVEEDQPTLEGNARKKAQESARASGLWALADDSGLEVEALDGAPGVLSARYAGAGCDYDANNRKLLKELEGVPPKKRRAVFRTAMALCGPRGELVLEEGRLEGEIAQRPEGRNGFGYDPIFLVPEAGKTLAGMSQEEKNSLSHRSRALSRIVPHIRRLVLGMVAVCAVAAPAAGARTEPGEETVWDQIMASQAHRGLRQGSRHLDEKRYDLALKEFLKAVAANPKDATAHMLLGAAYYWTGEVDKSLESYRESLRLEPHNAQAFMLVGISLAWKGDARGAYEAFKKSAEIDPERADIQMNLGSIKESLGLMTESLEHFRKAAAREPREPLYHFQLGMLYRKLGRDAEAAESLRQAIKFYDGFEDAWLELGAVEERRGDAKAAIHSFKKAVNLKTRDSVARLRLGRLYLRAGDAGRARAILTDAFHLTPEGAGAGLQLSIAYAAGKKPPAAGSREEPAASPPESNDPLDIFGRNLERIPLNQEALMQVDVAFVPKPQLVQASPESPSSLKKALERELGMERRSPTVTRREYRIESATPAARDRQIARILEDLRALRDSAPPGSDIRLGMNLNFTRLSDVSSGRAGSGQSPAVSYQPRQVGNDLGLWVMGTGWMALVEEVLPDPGEPPGHPDQSDWWVTTGLGFAALGEGQRALSAFERACRLDPGNETAWLGRGVAHVMTGDERAAAASYKEVLKINPKNKPAGEGLKWLSRPPGKTQGDGGKP